MYFYSNELHKPNQVMGLDNDDMLPIFLAVFLAIYVSIKTLLITVPVIIWMLKTKTGKKRGFIRHSLYAIGFMKIDGYPSITKNRFYQ